MKLFRLLLALCFLFSSNVFAAEDTFLNNGNFRCDTDGKFYYVSQTPEQQVKPFNIVYVSKASDFPAPIENVIYPEDGYRYRLVDDVEIKYPMDLTENKIVIDSTGFQILNFTGAGSLFIGNPFQFRLEDIRIVGDLTNTLFDLEYLTATGAELFLLRGMNIEQFGDIGTVKGGVCTLESIAAVGCGGGIIFDTNQAVNISTLFATAWQNLADTIFITTQGVTPSFVMNNAIFFPQSNELMFNLTNTFVSGRVTNSTFSTIAGGGTFESGSQDQTSLAWNFSGTYEISDSVAIAQIGFQDNAATETIIDTADVPVRINGTFEACDICERFTGNSSGTLTYTGLENIKSNVDLFSGALPVSGTAIEMGVYIALTQSETYEVTFTNGTDVVNRTDHGLANDTSIRFSNSGGALPAEIRDDQFYWVINQATNTFEISETEGGAALDFTDDGSGTSYYSLGEILEVSEVSSNGSAGQDIAASFSTGTFVDLTTGDKIEAFIDNHETTSNIIVERVNLKVA